MSSLEKGHQLATGVLYPSFSYLVWGSTWLHFKSAIQFLQDSSLEHFSSGFQQQEAPSNSSVNNRELTSLVTHCALSVVYASQTKDSDNIEIGGIVFLTFCKEFLLRGVV